MPKIIFSNKIWYVGNDKALAERGFDPRTSGLWAQHASTAPLCNLSRTLLAFTLQYNVKSQYNHTHLSKKEDNCNLHIISRLGKNKYTC